jgi:hypothetical protein
MFYFIFNKFLPNVKGNLYKIAKNDTDFQSLGLNNNHYDIKTVTESNFDEIRLNLKSASLINSEIVYENTGSILENINQAQAQKDYLLNNYDLFIRNSNSPLTNRASDCFNYINNYDLNNIVYPTQISFEKHIQNSTNIEILSLLQL